MGSSILLMVVMFAVFWFMLIRPQQKRQREHQEMLKNLKKGDQVVTSGGIVGRISGMTDQVIILEVQEKVRMRVLRPHVQNKFQGADAGAGSGDGEKSKHDKHEKSEKNDKSESKSEKSKAEAVN